MKSDTDQMRRFLSRVMPPGTCLELRILRATFGRNGFIEAGERYTSTYAGWYDNPDSLIVDASRARGVNVFVTLNPVNPALLSRSYNKIIKCRYATENDDIAVLRWLYLDIDSIRPPDISATDEELAIALSTRDRILWENPVIAESAITGVSGNGAFIFVRLPDLTNNSENRQLIADVLAGFAAKYSTDRVTIDVKTKNPARITVLPGTWKCKGSNRPERPWRISKMDTP